MDYNRLKRIELSRLTGYSETTVDGWIRTGCPRRPDGRYALSAVVRWLAEERIASNAANPERSRLLRAQAKRQELRLSRESGEVVAVEDALDYLEAVVTALREKLLAMPDRISPHIVAANDLREVKTILSGHVEAMLRDMASIDPESFTRRENPGDNKPRHGRAKKGATA